jgi:hypothetical protein
MRNAYLLEVLVSMEVTRGRLRGLSPTLTTLLAEHSARSGRAHPRAVEQPVEQVTGGPDLYLLRRGVGLLSACQNIAGHAR